MHRNSVLVHSSNSLFIAALIVYAIGHAQAQTSLSVSQPTRSVSILDSTKEQDGLIGSVRRIKTEAAKVELKDGRVMEGPMQLLEVTTYGIKGNRLENVSYPQSDVQVGKEEYKYDDRGNITEMTARDEKGAILSRESYSYEFDKVGNWTKMTTSLIVFENGQLKHEPIENTYRTITYYFTDDIAKMVESPAAGISRALPQTEPTDPDLEALKLNIEFGARNELVSTSDASIGNPPALLVRQPATVSPDRNKAPKTPVELVTNKSAHSVESATARSTSSTSNVGRTPDASKREEAANSTRSSSSNIAPAKENESGSTATVEDTPRAVALSFYEKGLDSFDKGDTQGAISEFLISVKFEPSGQVYLSLGNAYLKLEKNKDALAAFQQSVNLIPKVAEAHYALGLASFRLKRFAPARDAFKNAITLAPNMAKAHYGLGLSLLELGSSDASTAEVKILEKLDKQLARQLAAATPRLNYTCRFSVCN